jgi:hypothetical protein
MAKEWRSNAEFINTKWRVWLDTNEYWNYIYIDKLTGKMYVMVENHYYEPIEEHMIREFETYEGEVKHIGVDD